MAWVFEAILKKVIKAGACYGFPKMCMSPNQIAVCPCTSSHALFLLFVFVAICHLVSHRKPLGAWSFLFLSALKYISPPLGTTQTTNNANGLHLQVLVLVLEPPKVWVSGLSQSPLTVYKLPSACTVCSARLYPDLQKGHQNSIPFCLLQDFET